MVLKFKHMEENKKQTSNSQPTVECSKCHKYVSTSNGVQSASGFVCNECKNKSKKRLMMGLIGGVLVISAIIAGLGLTDKKPAGDGFDGIGTIDDSISVSVSQNKVKFDLATATAVSSSVTTQAPISNLDEFKRVLAQNITNAENENSTSIELPAISPLFAINTNYFVKDGEALVKEFASVYSKTNKTATILVKAYTCDLGGARLNEKLSETRAIAVKNVLVKAGIPETNIELKWYGKSRYNDFTYSDKSEYRRVILSIK